MSLRLSLLLSGLLLLSTSCVDGGRPGASTATTTTTTTTTTTIVPAHGGAIPVCATEDPPFALDGSVGTIGSPQSDSAQLTRIDWFSTPECARIQFFFASAGGAPALDPPAASAVLVRNIGALRISLGETVVGSAIFDQLLDLPHATAIYVVRGQTGSVFIDIHLDAPVEARLTAQSAPGVLNVDLRPAGEPYPSKPIRTPDAVILEPTGGSVRSPVVVSGYARPGANLTFTLHPDTGNPTQTSVEVPAQDLMWNTYAVFFTTIEIGPARLQVGERVVAELLLAE